MDMNLSATRFQRLWARFSSKGVYRRILTRDGAKHKKWKQKMLRARQTSETPDAAYDSNQFTLLSSFRDQIKGPVLEVGSLQVGSTTTFRGVFKEQEYVGLDLQAGANVDVICDLTKGIGDLKADYFDLIICCSVMEHTPQPWLMADNMTRLLRPGGKLFVSVPWVWRYHKCPGDYFRFTPAGVRSLFPNIEWEKTYMHTNLDGDIQEVDEAGIENKLSLIGELSHGRYRKFLPYMMVTMFGHRSC